MAGCGYICPLCEGKGIDDTGKTCTWCQKEKSDWIEKVHGECSCSDIGKLAEGTQEQNED